MFKDSSSAFNLSKYLLTISFALLLYLHPCFPVLSLLRMLFLIFASTSAKLLCFLTLSNHIICKRRTECFLLSAGEDEGEVKSFSTLQVSTFRLYLFLFFAGVLYVSPFIIVLNIEEIDDFASSIIGNGTGIRPGWTVLIYRFICSVELLRIVKNCLSISTSCFAASSLFLHNLECNYICHD